MITNQYIKNRNRRWINVLYCTLSSLLCSQCSLLYLNLNDSCEIYTSFSQCSLIRRTLLLADLSISDKIYDHLMNNCCIIFISFDIVKFRSTHYMLSNNKNYLCVFKLNFSPWKPLHAFFKIIFIDIKLRTAIYSKVSVKKLHSNKSKNAATPPHSDASIRKRASSHFLLPWPLRL